MTTTATFSNGFADTYKGDRAVRAAWAITSKADGAVLKSGHSLDRAKAAKTAEGKLHELHDLLGYGHPLYFYKGASPRYTAAMNRARKAHNAERLELIRSFVTVEIVDL